MLTPTQHRLLVWIDGYIRQSGGVSPTLNEMSIGMGRSSKSKAAMHQTVLKLVERGFLRHTPGRKRNIEVLRLPESGMPSVDKFFGDAIKALRGVVEAFDPGGSAFQLAIAIEAARIVLTRATAPILPTARGRGPARPASSSAAPSAVELDPAPPATR